MGQIYGPVLGIKRRRTLWNGNENCNGMRHTRIQEMGIWRRQTQTREAREKKTKTKLYMSLAHAHTLTQQQQQKEEEKRRVSKSAWTNIMKFAAQYRLGNILFELERSSSMCMFSRWQYIWPVCVRRYACVRLRWTTIMIYELNGRVNCLGRMKSKLWDNFCCCCCCGCYCNRCTISFYSFVVSFVLF